MDDEEIFGFVKARRESKNEGIDKIWLATYIFELDKIAVIYLFEEPRFDIYEITHAPLDKLNEQILNDIKEKYKSFLILKLTKRSSLLKTVCHVSTAMFVFCFKNKKLEGWSKDEQYNHIYCFCWLWQDRKYSKPLYRPHKFPKSFAK